MLIKNPDDIKSSEITDEKHFRNRRAFIRGVALVTTATATGGRQTSRIRPANLRQVKMTMVMIAGVRTTAGRNTTDPSWGV